jgi:ankyrin repeat protein
MASRLCTSSAANGYKAMAELLLTNKAEVNAKDNDGSPPLHQVAAGRHSDLSEMMLAHGADVNAADKMDPPLAGATHSRNHSGQARARRSDCLRWKFACVDSTEQSAKRAHSN